MSAHKPDITRQEIARAFEGGLAAKFPPILSPKQLAELLGQFSVKTVYEWTAMGRFDGSFRKRGKHLLFWRDRVIDLLFNGKDWNEIK